MCKLTQADEIQEVLLRHFKIGTEIHEISSEDFDDCVQKLHASLKKSNHSIMLSITHECIAGHWIILDEINMIEKTADIRDPYSGHAFRLSFAELQQNLGEEDALGFHIQHYLQVTSLPSLDDGEVAPD
ncbi:MAG: hypothetical protein H7A40_07465 [Chlamydiales bacterium]|nr:hypothetical protein [Chlamydiales bacterium]